MSNAKLPPEKKKRYCTKKQILTFNLVLLHIKCSFTLYMKMQLVFKAVCRQQSENYDLGDEYG